MIHEGMLDQQEKQKKIQSPEFRVLLSLKKALAQANLFQEEAVDTGDPWKLRNPDLKSFSRKI